MDTEKRGAFITFEGGEGAGKTVQIRTLAETLRGMEYDVLCTREPGGTDIGNQVRQVIIDMKNQAMLPRTELLLFQASRAQLVEQVINPHLANGGVVLCDRFADSTEAYQGYGHNISLGVLQPIVRFATGGLQPDLTLLLDTPVEVGLSRKRFGQEWNRLDAAAKDFHERLRLGFWEMTMTGSARWRFIDATKSIEEVARAINHEVLTYLETRAVGLLGANTAITR